jgi:hypothetical protein
MWITTVRRISFVLALLGIGAVTVACFHLSFNSSWAQSGSRNPMLVAFGTFAWGADSLGLVLGAWLAARHLIWKSWSGRVRAFSYVLAYSYGRMLFSATQNWLHQMGPDGRTVPADLGPIPFRWPGSELQDFARPALDLLTLLTLVWVLVPIFVVLRAELCEERDRLQVRPTFSIFFLFSWTTVSAVILLWIRFLTWKGVAPRTAYSYVTPTQALSEYVTENMPSQLIVAAVVVVAAWAWSGRWWRMVAGLLAALLIDSFGHNLLYAILKWATGSSQHGGVLSGPMLEHWSYIAGRNCLIWAAFGIAALTGVRLKRATVGSHQSEPRHKTNPTNRADKPT